MYRFTEVIKLKNTVEFQSPIVQNFYNLSLSLHEQFFVIELAQTEL